MIVNKYVGKEYEELAEIFFGLLEQKGNLKGEIARIDREIGSIVKLCDKRENE